MTPLHVEKLRADGSLAYSWDGEVLHQDAEGLVLRAAFNVDARSVGPVTLRRGDVFHEFYYWDRWYNVYQIASPDGVLKGWYANVGEPARLAEDGSLQYVDLELDVWVNPDGSHVVLDEPEFESLLAGEPDERRAASARAARDTLLAMVERRALPVWQETADRPGAAG